MALIARRSSHRSNSSTSAMPCVRSEILVENTERVNGDDGSFHLCMNLVPADTSTAMMDES